MIMRLFLIPLFLLLSCLARAQELRPVQCRFLCFGGAEEELPLVLSASKEGVDVSCPLSADAISPAIVCFAEGNSIDFVLPDGKTPVAKATIPPSVKSTILVFVATPKKPGEADSATRWRVLVIEDTAKNFPDGGIFIANFFNNDIRFVLGEHMGKLRAGGSRGYARPAERDAFNMAPVIVEFLNEEKWQIANESALRFLPGMRYLIFAYVDPVSGRPRINTYQDLAN
jgi:hypothetical protein